MSYNPNWRTGAGGGNAVLLSSPQSIASTDVSDTTPTAALTLPAFNIGSTFFNLSTFSPGDRLRIDAEFGIQRTAGVAPSGTERLVVALGTTVAPTIFVNAAVFATDIIDVPTAGVIGRMRIHGEITGAAPSHRVRTFAPDITAASTDGLSLAPVERGSPKRIVDSAFISGVLPGAVTLAGRVQYTNVIAGQAYQVQLYTLDVVWEKKAA